MLTAIQAYLKFELEVYTTSAGHLSSVGSFTFMGPFVSIWPFYTYIGPFTIK